MCMQMSHAMVRALQASGVLELPATAVPFMRKGLDALNEGLLFTICNPVRTYTEQH